MVDPAGLAPAFSGDSTDVLLYDTTGPGPPRVILKQKDPFLQGSFCVTRFWSIVHRPHQCYGSIISKPKSMSIPTICIKF